MRLSPAVVVALLLSAGGHAALIALQTRGQAAPLAALPPKPRLLLPARVMGVELVPEQSAPHSAPAQTAPLPDRLSEPQTVVGSTAVGALEAETAKPGETAHYFSLREIDQRPVPTAAIELDAVIGFSTKSGRAVLRFWVSSAGFVDQVKIEETTLRDDVAVRLLRYATQLSFIPGQYRGVAVPSTFRVEVKLNEGEQGIGEQRASPG
jgi:hypothetical protein